jgi:hypothetical protein
VDESQQYSAAEMERMMKVQDVLLKAGDGQRECGAAADPGDALLVGQKYDSSEEFMGRFGLGQLAK